MKAQTGDIIRVTQQHIDNTQPHENAIIAALNDRYPGIQWSADRRTVCPLQKDSHGQWINFALPQEATDWLRARLYGGNVQPFEFQLGPLCD